MCQVSQNTVFGTVISKIHLLHVIYSAYRMKKTTRVAAVQGQQSVSGCTRNFRLHTSARIRAVLKVFEFPVPTGECQDRISKIAINSEKPG